MIKTIEKNPIHKGINWKKGKTFFWELRLGQTYNQHFSEGREFNKHHRFSPHHSWN